MSSLYAWLGLVALILGGIGAVWLAARRAGSNAELVKTAQATAEIKDAQLKDSTMPRDRDSVAERMRRHDF